MSYRIDEACGENWDGMEERDGGRHCKSCDHVVVDATDMTKREFDRYFESAGDKVCARVLVNPVGDGVFRRAVSRPRPLGSFVLLSSLLASACGSDAQPTSAEPVVAEPVVAEPVVAEPVVAEPVVAEPVVAEPVVAETVVAEPVAIPLDRVRVTRMGGIRRH